MSFGYYRVGSQVNDKRTFQRYAEALAADSHKYGSAPRPGGDEPEPIPIGDPPPEPINPTMIGSGVLKASEAKLQGYTGNSCHDCGSVRMKISGHCEVCESCGATTGCS